MSLLLYVESGTGRLEDGKQYRDLREGIALLVPPMPLIVLLIPRTTL